MLLALSIFLRLSLFFSLSPLFNLAGVWTLQKIEVFEFYHSSRALVFLHEFFSSAIKFQMLPKFLSPSFSL